MALTFQHNPSRHRYEALSDGTLAGFVQYSESSGDVALTHTETVQGFEGKGVGSFVAKAALEDIKRQGKHVIPRCSFIADYIRKHPEYSALQK